MTFAEWLRWLAGLPWALRWFVPLVLVRPFVDTLYFLKDVSPFVSPPYIVGALTPILIIASLSSKRIPRIEWCNVDLLFLLWGSLMVFNALAALAIRISLASLEVSLKLATPVLIYFFLRHLVQTKRDLAGILTTFLYSSVPVFGMMIYERLVSPLGAVPTFTRGFYRYSGLFADVMGYSVYFVGAFLVAGYMYLAAGSKDRRRKAAIRLGIVSSLCLLGLLHIHHNTSWGVVGVLSIILLYETFRTGKVGLTFFLVALFTVLGILFSQGVSQHLEQSFGGEVAVLEGQSGEAHAFHGRMSRWTRYVDRWEGVGPVPMLFGVSLTSEQLETGMIFGIHNDYLRVVFCSGLVGLALYLLFYLCLVLGSCRMRSIAERFLLRGAIALILLYSISTVPTLYYGLLYLCLSVFAFAALLEGARGTSAGRAAQGIQTKTTVPNHA